MKHPLTSKERRGLFAVAAAALLCIASGPALRHCRGRYVNPAAKESIHFHQDGTAASQPRKSHEYSDSTVGKSVSKSRSSCKQSEKAGSKKQKRRDKRKSSKSKKTYPDRQPLDQPID